MPPPDKIKRHSHMTTKTLLADDLGESSSDSDFRIEDLDDDSDDISYNSNDQSDDEDAEDEEEEEDNSDDESDGRALMKQFVSSPSKTLSVTQLIEQAKDATAVTNITKILNTLICCACLGDNSDDTNEIVECDNCGILVHEGCYGISDSGSISSTVSSCSTEPWFCESCKAGIMDPVCELCPNKGGIFKETDVGKWVHLVCALYVPGVAFGEVDQLTSVTLFEMQYNKWGAKTCSLCEDSKFARTGVCIGCDAGMCKTYFHVTCAQAAGFLSEAHSEEADQADPFYAHCKIHSDKMLIKHRKRNYNALKLCMERKNAEKEKRKSDAPTVEQLRIERKLKKRRAKYISNKITKHEPWVPTQKIPRLLSTSASACRKLLLKAELMGIDGEALEFQEAQMAALAEVRKKWHIPPAFSVEFIGYYLERGSRLRDIKMNLEKQMESNKTLLERQQYLREKYDSCVQLNKESNTMQKTLKESALKLFSVIKTLCPTKSLPHVDNIGKPVPNTIIHPPVEHHAEKQIALQPRTMPVPTAAALKMGVGFPLINLQGIDDSSNRVLSTQCASYEMLNQCGICKRINDQHLLAQCDSCKLSYHLGCLNPPLTRHPKKTKLYTWHCSECDKSDESDNAAPIPRPRKSRTRFSKDGSIVPVDSPKQIIDCKGAGDMILQTNISNRASSASLDGIEKHVISQNGINALNISDTGIQSKKKRGRPLKYPRPDGPIQKKLKSPSMMVTTSVESMENIIDMVARNATDPVNDQSSVNYSQNNSVEDISFNNPQQSSSPHKSKMNKKMRKEKRQQARIDKQLARSKSLQDYNQGSVNNLPTNGETTVNQSMNEFVNTTTLEYKQIRKKRKEKHRPKRTSDSEPSLGKDYKRKRKKKNHSRDNEGTITSSANNSSADTIPKIKIKIKTLPLPGEPTTEPKFLYVSADMVRSFDHNSSSRPVSVESVEDNNSILHSPNSLNEQSQQDDENSPNMRRKNRLSVSFKGNNKKDQLNDTVENNYLCDVCQQIGTVVNVVKCDECQKNYHFSCLEPPLKKTPKKRGYSWHCADCDPTDVE